MALPAPAHVNQLTAGTRFPSGKPSGPYDCAVAAGRMALDAYSRGALRPSTTAFRAAQSDQDHDGIGLDDIAVAWRAFGQQFDHGHHPFRAVYARLVAGDGACIPGHYLNLGSWRASSFGDDPKDRGGPHMMWLQRTAPGGILTDDPLRSSAVVIPTAAIERFYGGSAGWGHGVYVGDATGPGTGATADQWNAVISCATGRKTFIRGIISADNAGAIASCASEQGVSLAGVNLADYYGKTLSQLRDALAATGAIPPAELVPDIPGAIGDAAVGVVVNVAIAGSIIGLAYMGLRAILTSPASIGRG